MPFIAYMRQTRERVDITKIHAPRQVLKAGELVCQLCGAEMIIKAGMIKRPHFAHASSCSSAYGSHPESAEHRAGKEYLRAQLPLLFQEYREAALEYEVPIPSIHRVVDLLVTFPKGHTIAHEVQLASITVEQLEERTADYERAGIDVVWWLGKSADTPATRAWCIQKFGISFLIDYRSVLEYITLQRSGA